jgi:hypothetical protein
MSGASVVHRQYGFTNLANFNPDFILGGGGDKWCASANQKKQGSAP